MLSRLSSSKAVFQEIIRKCDNFLFDCDGVLWHGDKPVSGAISVVNQLQRHKKNVLFITNNSGKTREKFLEKFENFGFKAQKENIFGTAYTSALFIKSLKASGKVYLVGNDAMAKELEDMEIDYFGNGPDNQITTRNCRDIVDCFLEENVKAVLVGFDGHFSYTKLVKAAAFINNQNCFFIGTNEDQCTPVPGLNYGVPGGGCIVGSVSVAAGKTPDVLCGKPESFMFKCIQDEFDLDPSRTIMIGDTMNTDILFGKRNKLHTLLVLSGIETKESLENVLKSSDPAVKEQAPHYYMSSVGDWTDFLQQL